MQQECQKLYHEFGAIAALAKDVHHLRTRVEKLEACVTSKIKVRTELVPACTHTTCTVLEPA